MALFRMAVAAGILFVLAPEQTTKAVRDIWGVADQAKAQAAPAAAATAEAAIAYCRANPEVCLYAAKQAAGLDPAKLEPSQARPKP